MERIYCQVCHKPVNPSDSFCANCGTRIEPEEFASPGAPGPEKPLLTDERALTKIRLNWGYEWKSSITVFGLPLVHIAIGMKEGKLRVAKGIIAIGQFAIGLFTIAQFGIGVFFGFGQFILGLTAIAQFAGSILFGVGQFATGYIVIGQMVFGYYALAQTALAYYAWTPRRNDPAAVAFFTNLLHYFKLR